MLFVHLKTYNMKNELSNPQKQNLLEKLNVSKLNVVNVIINKQTKFFVEASQAYLKFFLFNILLRQHIKNAAYIQLSKSMPVDYNSITIYCRFLPLKFLSV